MGYQGQAVLLSEVPCLVLKLFSLCKWNQLKN